MSPFKRTCTTTAWNCVICVKREREQRVSSCCRHPCFPKRLMRLQPFKRLCSCQCVRLFHVLLTSCPLLGPGATGQRVWSSCPGQSHWSSQMTAWCKSRWWCWDCLVLFSGGMGMAQGFSAWLPPDKLLPWMASPCNYHLSRRSFDYYSTSENVRQNTACRQDQLANCTPRLNKGRWTCFFKIYIPATIYGQRFRCKNKSCNRTKQIHE